jgi:hypothetical protein
LYDLPSLLAPGVTLFGVIFLVEAFVDLGYFLNPLPAFPMFQPHDLLIGPMEVKGDIGYLLKEPGRGVA